jgi:hypothetical protein
MESPVCCGVKKERVKITEKNVHMPGWQQVRGIEALEKFDRIG